MVNSVFIIETGFLKIICVQNHFKYSFVTYQNLKY